MHGRTGAEASLPVLFVWDQMALYHVGIHALLEIPFMSGRRSNSSSTVHMWLLSWRNVGGRTAMFARSVCV